MSHSPTSSSTGVLDRPRQEGRDRAPTTPIPVPTDPGIAAPETDESVELVGDRSLRTPALVAVATAAIVEGYRWLGVIPTGHAGISSLSSSHAVVVPLALALALAGHALTHQRKPRRRRQCGAAVTWAGATVTGAAITLVTLGGGLPPHALGVAYLLLAAALLSAAAMSARPGREWRPDPVDPAVRSGSDPRCRPNPPIRRRSRRQPGIGGVVEATDRLGQKKPEGGRQAARSGNEPQISDRSRRDDFEQGSDSRTSTVRFQGPAPRQ